MKLGRSLSFKRKVKSGLVKSAPADASSESRILIKGEVCLSHALSSNSGTAKHPKFVPGFVVAYAGVDGGLTINLYKSTKDFTTFRSFPDDVVYLTSSRIVEEAAMVLTLPAKSSFCLHLEGDGRLAQPPLLLSFGTRDEMASWRQALQPTAKKSSAPPSPLKQPRRVDGRVDAARRRLESARRNAVAERAETARIIREYDQTRLNYERLVDMLTPDLEEAGVLAPIAPGPAGAAEAVNAAARGGAAGSTSSAPQYGSNY